MDSTIENKKNIKARELFSMSASEAFGVRLKQLREAIGITQADLAAELGVSRGSIGYYENNERTPDIEFLSAVAQKFDVTYDYLLGESVSAIPEYANISDRLMLSDYAISKIFELDDYNQILSRIIENDSFDNLFKAIENFIDKENDEFDLSEYYAFMVSKLFTTILTEIKKDFQKEVKPPKDGRSITPSADEQQTTDAAVESYNNSLAGKTRRYFSGKEGDDNAHNPET